MLCCVRSGQYEESGALCKEALAGLERVLGKGHPETCRVAGQLRTLPPFLK